MIKYIILYKNGKTWNGKAASIHQIKAFDCLLLITQPLPGKFKIYTPFQNRSWSWVGDRTFFKNPVRTPNPASVTKKQKAFDKAYANWVMDRTELVEYGYVDKVDTSIKAYKKWLWEQKLEKQAEDNHKSTLIPTGTKILIKFTSGKEEVYTTVGGDSWFSLDTAGDIADYEVLDEQKQSELKGVLKETSLDEFVRVDVPDGFSTSDGWIPWFGGECPVPKDSRVEVRTRGGVSQTLYEPHAYWWSRHDELEWCSDIVAYRLLDEDDKPIKYSKPLAEFRKQIEEFKEQLHTFDEGRTVLCTQRTWDELGWGKQPIKTTYTFWLGAFGEIGDE